MLYLCWNLGPLSCARGRCGHRLRPEASQFWMPYQKERSPVERSILRPYRSEISSPGGKVDGLCVKGDTSSFLKATPVTAYERAWRAAPSQDDRGLNSREASAVGNCSERNDRSWRICQGILCCTKIALETMRKVLI